MSKRTQSRELRAMGCRKLSARPRHHAPAAGAVEAFQKNWPATVATIGLRDRRLGKQRNKAKVRIKWICTTGKVCNKLQHAYPNFQES